MATSISAIVGEAGGRCYIIHGYDRSYRCGFQTRVGATLTVEAGVFLRDGFALAASAMLPTSTDNVGTGSIAALGNLGDETVGLYSATAQYHLGLRGPVTPYAGAGIGYMHVFDTVDGAVSGMSVAHAFGGVVQLGVDVALTDNIGFFMDYKQYFISTRATGTLMGNVIYADARVDPLVITSGVSVSF